MTVVCSVPDAGRRIALTFDHGPSQYTNQLCEILTEGDARATFFVQGAAVAAESSELLKRLHDAGHEIGNHTENHLHLSDALTAESEIEATHERLVRLLGLPPLLIRPPMGRGIATVDTCASKLGYRATVLWNVSPNDWAAPSVEEIVERVLGGENPAHDEISNFCAWSPLSPLEGAIVLLHDGWPRQEPVQSRRATVRAVRKLVPALQDRGFEFVTVSRLMADRLPPLERSE